jgi:hypothetical protein
MSYVHVKVRVSKGKEKWSEGQRSAEFLLQRLPQTISIWLSISWAQTHVSNTHNGYASQWD